MKEMDKILEYLKQLELSDEEATLYLTLLQTGSVSVKSLAEEVDIKRTTSYIYINTLIQKGLIVKVVKGAQKMVAANDPKDCLEDLVKQKLQKSEEIKKNFPTMLSSMTASMSTANDVNDAEIKYYKGKNGVKKIYDEVLQAKELRSYVNIEEIAKVFPENFESFNQVFLKNPHITMFEIVESSPQSQKYTDFSKKNPGYHQKLLPKDMQLAAQDILIYNDRVAIINLKGNIQGVILRNIDLYNNFKMLYDFTWRMLP